MPTVPKDLATRYPVALVSGASSGIGQAIALALLQQGITVYGTSRQPDRPSLHPDIHWLPLEAASQEGIYAFIRDNPDLLSKVDILVNNAGQGCFGSIDSIPREAITQIHNLLLEAPVQLTRAVLPGMRERGRGVVVNISSLAALFPLPYMAIYTAGKAGLSAFTRSLMLTEPHGPLVFIDFQAGDYRTDFNDNMPQHGKMDEARQRAWAQLEAHLAAGPPPSEAAGLVLKAIRKGRSRVIRGGGLFQRVVAPLGVRLLPGRLLLAAIRRYYKLPG
jgi:NAD(P)-dependent dehydrogenase (short-subunit alcohol dehydrogenase family)